MGAGSPRLESLFGDDPLREYIASRMERQFLFDFIRARKLAILSTVAKDGSPQSALVGFAVTPELELIFDTVSTSRKYANLQTDQRIAFVFGWEDEVTVQYEGIASQPRGDDLHRYKKAYFAAWPDGPQREKWPNIAYFAVRPRWIRYSDFNKESYKIEEMVF
jgi:general stress protein 26